MKLEKVDIRDPKPQDVCETSVTNSSGSGTWNEEGVILLGSVLGVQKVSASGGQLTALFPGDSTDTATAAIEPVFLPDGRHFLHLGLEPHQSPDYGIYLAIPIVEGVAFQLSRWPQRICGIQEWNADLSTQYWWR